MALCSVVLHAAAPKASNTLTWDKSNDRVDADVRELGLGTLLERVATVTGWQVFVEPGTTHTASAKFTDVASGDALRLLLGDLNFTLVPQTNSGSRLYVFRTEMKRATRQIKAFHETPGSKRIPNELIVKLKPGADINELARKLGAKVIGCIENLHVCRLQFASAEAADAARESLALNTDVEAVDYNYSIDRPGLPHVSGSATTPLGLQLKPSDGSGEIVIGLVDTEIQALCGDLNKFVLNPISVVGTAQTVVDGPTHATGMANMMLSSLDTATQGSTSVHILPVNVYGGNASTSSYDVANGIVTAVNNGANIINLSLGGQSDSPFLQSVVQAVQASGIPIIAAAGNEPVATPFYPAAYPGVVAVTALEQGQIAPYANRGNFVDVAAPDSGVFCFNGQSYYVAGTSAAAAYTTGAAAGMADATKKDWSDIIKAIQQQYAVPTGK